ncbi:hypothetical protein D3C81_96210 [compost metagenome]
MKKTMVVATMAVVMLIGGVTAFAANGPELKPGAGDLVVVNAEANPGEYRVNNDIISANWNALTQEQKNRYVNNKNSAPVEFFPFGIDTTVSQPKGFPTSSKAQNPANYPPTRPLPALDNE